MEERKKMEAHPHFGDTHLRLVLGLLRSFVALLGNHRLRHYFLYVVL